MKFLGRSLLVVTTALLLTALGFAQSNVEYDQYGNKVSPTADHDQYGDDVFQTANPQFMKDAAQDAMAKIHLAYLALQNAQNEQVRAFAQQILNDYGKTQADLFNIANQQSLVLPNTLDAKNLDTFDALSQLKGAEFDKAYMKAMLNADQTAASRFKQEATRGDAWAGHTLPTLESSLKEAQKVALAIGVQCIGETKNPV
jgi:putative membrane protein